MSVTENIAEIFSFFFSTGFFYLRSIHLISVRLLTCFLYYHTIFQTLKYKCVQFSKAIEGEALAEHFRTPRLKLVTPYSLLSGPLACGTFFFPDVYKTWY